jgi:hypothetical protein
MALEDVCVGVFAVGVFSSNRADGNSPASEGGRYKG